MHDHVDTTEGADGTDPTEVATTETADVDRHALTDLRVWVTAERRAHNQRRYLEARGAEVLEAPLLKTIDDPLGSDCESVGLALIRNPPEIFIAQTGQGVAWWTDRLTAETKDAFLRALRDVTIWSRGAKSTSRCRSLGLDVEWQCPSESASEIADRCRHLPPGTRVAVQLVGTVGDVILDALQDIGADVTPMPIYRYALPENLESVHEFINATIAGDIDAITFTASPAISHLRSIAKEIGRLDPLDKAMQLHCSPVVVGPVCATTAMDAGWQHIVEPESARLIPMLDALTAALAKPRPTDTAVPRVT